MEHGGGRVVGQIPGHPLQGSPSELPQTVVTQLEISIVNTAGEPQSHFGWQSPVSSSRLFSALPPVLFLKQSLSCYPSCSKPYWARELACGTWLFVVKPVFLSSPLPSALQCACHTPAASDLCLLRKHLIRPFRILLLFHRPSSAKFNFLSCLLANS